MKTVTRVGVAIVKPEFASRDGEVGFSPSFMRAKKLLLTCLIAVHAIASVEAQGTFQNFDFEQANVPVVPPGQYGADVPVGQGLPGWTAYTSDSTTPVGMVLHNNLSLGAPAISILGPSWTSGGILQGNYSVLLQPSFPGLAVEPSIAQTGMIPVASQSIRYSSKLFYETAGVSFGGQTLPVSILGGSLAAGFIFGADVSAFGGQTGELRFSGGGYLDDIFFSPQPIPEPRAIGLFALGALFLGWRLRNL